MVPVAYDDPLHSIFCLQQPFLLPWKSIGAVHSSERIRALERLPQSWDTQQATMKKAMDPILKFRRSLLRSPNLFPAFAVARQSLLDIAPAMASQEFGMHSCVYNHRGCWWNQCSYACGSVHASLCRMHAIVPWNSEGYTAAQKITPNHELNALEL